MRKPPLVCQREGTNRKPGDPRVSQRQEIVIAVGTPPDNIPSSFDFAAVGLLDSNPHEPREVRYAPMTHDAFGCSPVSACGPGAPRDSPPALHPRPVGVPGPLDTLRGWLWGYELWAAFIVAAVATGGSLSTRRSPATSRASSAGVSGSACTRSRSSCCSWRSGAPPGRAVRVALPIVGAGVSLYHMLIGYGAITEPKRCSIAVPEAAGSTGSALRIFRLPPDRNARVHRLPPSHRILVLASIGTAEDAATLPANA